MENTNDLFLNNSYLNDLEIRSEYSGENYQNKQDFLFSDNENNFYNKYEYFNEKFLENFINIDLTKKFQDYSSDYNSDSINIIIDPDKEVDIFEQKKDNNSKQENNKEEKKSIDDIETKDLNGKKRKKSKNNDNKYTPVSILRKIKNSLIQNLRIFINSIIFKNYNGDIGPGTLKKELLKIDISTKSHAKENKEFLNKTLKEIFSFNIGGKYTNYDKNHNKNLINKLLNEKNLEKKLQYEKIFGLTFFDCLEHFRGTTHIKELEGLETLDKFIKKYEEDKDYIALIEDIVSRMEKIITGKRERNRQKGNSN